MLVCNISLRPSRRRLTASSGSYGLAGAAAAIQKLDASQRVMADGGSYSLAGTAANILNARRMAAAGGSYSLTGAAATITATSTAATRAAAVMATVPVFVNTGATPRDANVAGVMVNS